MASPAVTPGDALFFGCWNEPGHYLFLPGGREGWSLDRKVTLYGDGLHIDGTLAPRSLSRVFQEFPHAKDPWCAAFSKSERERSILGFSTGEYPQGQFLRHELPHGYSAIQWWDRCQGDTRGGCSSTVLLPGQRTTAELLDALHGCFPSVAENLRRSGINLVEVKQ